MGQSTFTHQPRSSPDGGWHLAKSSQSLKPEAALPVMARMLEMMVEVQLLGGAQVGDCERLNQGALESNCPISWEFTPHGWGKCVSLNLQEGGFLKA